MNLSLFYANSINNGAVKGTVDDHTRMTQSIIMVVINELLVVTAQLLIIIECYNLRACIIDLAICECGIKLNGLKYRSC